MSSQWKLNRLTLPPALYRRMGMCLIGPLACLVSLSCAPAESTGAAASENNSTRADPVDYCALAPTGLSVQQVRPGAGEEPIDDVNWFARPVVHDGDDQIVAFASHDQNYLYNLTNGVRVKIPDRSDAVSTPDGRYVTVPSYYTPDSNTRFYAAKPLLAALAKGEDADDAEPAYIHEHDAMSKVYYQSTSVVSEERSDSELVVIYRLMFSGTQHESKFRIVDFTFVHDLATEALSRVSATKPMALCAEITNDLNTPFISKDGRYVASYSSDSEERAYSAGASLKIFRILSTDPEAGTTRCEPTLDFGFAAGKADFSFSGDMLTFHISQGDYLTPFVNGGLEEPTITDIVVAKLEHDEQGNISGHSGLTRLTTSMTSGVGSYFPAFFPDGSLFYIANAVPKNSDAPKRFHFRVIDPRNAAWSDNAFSNDASRVQAEELAALWTSACNSDPSTPATELLPHEAPWLAYALSARQCERLVGEAKSGTIAVTSEMGSNYDWDGLTRLCAGLGG